MSFMPLVLEFHPLSPYETIVSCLTNKFWDCFREVTSIYEPQHGDASVCVSVLASHLPTATHTGSRASAH